MQHKVAEEGDWEIHNSPEKRLVAIHRCLEERTVPDHEEGRRLVQWKLPHVACFCKKSAKIYCPLCFEELPDELSTMMKLSGSHLKLDEVGMYFDDFDYQDF